MMEVEEQRHDVPQLRGDLFRELTEYYSGVYADIESDGPLEVSGFFNTTDMQFVIANFPAPNIISIHKTAVGARKG